MRRLTLNRIGIPTRYPAAPGFIGGAAKCLFTAGVLLLGLPWSSLAQGVAGSSTGGASLSGLVYEASGAGARGARIELVEMPSAFISGQRRLSGLAAPPPVASVTSDGEGRFVLATPETGAFRVVVQAEGHLSMQYFPLLLSGEAVELPPLVLTPGEETVVEVVGGARRPLGGAWVFGETVEEGVSADLGWRPSFRLGLTDGEGRARLMKATRERLAVTAFVPSSAPATHAGSVERLLTLTPEPGVARPIRVLSDDGLPMANVLVRFGRLAWPVGVTSGDGRLVISQPPGEAAALRLLAVDGRHQLDRLPAAPAVGLASDRDSTETFVLRSPTLVEGRVLDAATRRPLSAALVWPGGDPGAFVKTDASGRYRLVTSPAASFWYQIEARGRLPQRIRVEDLQSGRRQAPAVALARSTSGAGRVVDPSGVGIAGARLAVTRLSPPDRRPFVRPDPADCRAVSQEDGGWVLSGLEPGRSYEVSVSKPGFTSRAITWRVPSAGEGNPPWVITLSPDRGAVGRVVDLEQRAIADAEVAVVDPARRSLPLGLRGDVAADPLRVRTDAQGRFELAAIPAQVIDVGIRASGFAPMALRGLEVPAGKGKADLGTLVLVPGAAISGRVVDVAGEGIASAAVHVLEPNLSPDRFLEARLERLRPAATTDPRGHFRIADIPLADRRDLVVRAEGYVQGALRAIAAPPPQPVTVVLERSSGLHGWVRDEAGEAIDDADVAFEWRQRLASSEREIRVGAPILYRTQTDAEGYFRLSGMAPGPGSLTAFAAGFVTLEPIKVEAPAAGESHEVELVLEHGAVVEGRVSTTAEDPLPGVRVAIGDATGNSDAEGYYRIEGVAEGPATAGAFHRHYDLRQQEIEVEPGSNTLDWQFPPGHAVSGQVVEASGEGVPGALVVLDETPRGQSYRVRSLADGSFEFPTVADGSYLLGAERAGFAPGRADGEIAVMGERVRDLEIALLPGGTVRGRVLGLGFDELAGVTVMAQRHANERSWPAEVDYEGRYEIVDLPAGDWLLRAELEVGQREAEIRVTLPAGRFEITRDLEFEERLTLSGRVLYNDEPLAEALVSMRGFGVSAERIVPTDYRGEFRIQDLEPDSYRLDVKHQREWLTYSETLELSADRDLTVRLDSSIVGGQVIDAATSAGIDDATVSLRRIVSDGERGEGGINGSQCDEQGVFHFPRVTPGSYQLWTHQDGYEPSIEDLVINPGRTSAISASSSPPRRACTSKSAWPQVAPRPTSTPTSRLPTAECWSKRVAWWTPSTGPIYPRYRQAPGISG